MQTYFFILGMAASFTLIGFVCALTLACIYAWRWLKLTYQALVLQAQANAKAQMRAQIPIDVHDTVPQWVYDQTQAQLSTNVPGRH